MSKKKLCLTVFKKKKVLDPPLDLDPHQSVMGSSLTYTTMFYQVFVENCSVVFV